MSHVDMAVRAFSSVMLWIASKETGWAPPIIFHQFTQESCLAHMDFQFLTQNRILFYLNVWIQFLKKNDLIWAHSKHIHEFYYKTRIDHYDLYNLSFLAAGCKLTGYVWFIWNHHRRSPINIQ